MVLVADEIEVTTAAGNRAVGVTEALTEFAPGERREVLASSDARLILLLTPWPGSGHPAR